MPYPVIWGLSGSELPGLATICRRKALSPSTTLREAGAADGNCFAMPTISVSIERIFWITICIPLSPDSSPEPAPEPDWAGDCPSEAGIPARVDGDAPGELTGESGELGEGDIGQLTEIR